MTLGFRLRLLRTTLDLTQRQLAEKAGIEAVTLTRIETGSRQPHQTTVDFLVEALGVHPAALETDAACILEVARLRGLSLRALDNEARRIAIENVPPIDSDDVVERAIARQRQEDRALAGHHEEVLPFDGEEPAWLGVAKTLSALPPEKLAALAQLAEALKSGK